MKTSKQIRGWGLRKANGHVNAVKFPHDGEMCGQWLIWPTRKQAAHYAVAGQKPIRVVVQYMTESWELTQ